uniref:Centromere protein W n=1 Tax=Magallana gigas TaxID=29159 RepID=A0A8W8NES7_MAGGI
MLPKCPKQKLKASLKKKTHRTHIKPTKVDVLIWLGYITMMQKLAKAAQLQAREEKQNSVNSYHLRKVADQVLKSCKA